MFQLLLFFCYDSINTNIGMVMIMKQNPVEVGKRIRKIRTDLGYSMSQFGELVSDSPKTTVNNWERGINVPKEDKLKKIALLGKISEEELLYGSPEEFIYDVVKAHYQIEMEDALVKQLSGFMEKKKISSYDELGIVSLFQLILETSQIDYSGSYLSYFPIPGEENMYLVIPKHTEFKLNQPPVFYAFVNKNENTLHLLPYTFAKNKKELYLTPPELRNKGQIDYFTRQFPLIGLDLKGSKIAYYGLDKTNLDKKISWYCYDEVTEEYLIFKNEIGEMCERFVEEIKSLF